MNIVIFKQHITIIIILMNMFLFIKLDNINPLMLLCLGFTVAHNRNRQEDEN